MISAWSHVKIALCENGGVTTGSEPWTKRAFDAARLSVYQSSNREAARVSADGSVGGAANA